MKKQLTSLVDFWNKNRFTNKTLPQIPRGIFLSLLFFCVYFSLATQSIIPLTCKETTQCGSSTMKGNILIRPFIAQSGVQRCPLTGGTTNFSAFVPITENLRKDLEANNFNASAVFADLGSSDKTKWQISVHLKSTCDEECSEDGLPMNLSVFIGLLSDYEIVRTNTDNIAGFAIRIKNMAVSDLNANPRKHKNYEGSITIIEPCTSHTKCDCDPQTQRFFRGSYTAGISVTDVENNQEIRVQLIGESVPVSSSCQDCQ
jgi:hypothetical protein